jgi:hypothetical protein
MSIRNFCLTSTVCFAVVFAGCGKKPAADTGDASAPAPSAPTTVSVGDDSAAPPPPPPVAAPTEPAAPRPDGPPQEENVDGLTQITRAIQSFAISNERPPKDLNELVKAKLIPALPTPPPGKKFLYDPSRMSIKLVNQ